MLYLIFHLHKISLLFRDAVANLLDCSMELLFAKAFLFTPGSIRDFLKPKGTNHKTAGIFIPAVPVFRYAKSA
jgi:hypothetical protein